MLTLCWSPKGGSGTSVTAAALALAHAAAGRDTLLIDLGGDQPALLGIDAGPVEGVTDWLAAIDVPVDALTALEQPVTEGLRLLPRGRAGGLPPDRLEIVAELLATSPRQVVIDSGPVDREAVSSAAGRHVVVIRPCYLAAQRLRASAPHPAGAVLVVIEEAGRALRAGDVSAVGAIAATVSAPWDPAVARAVDAGTLVARRPRSLTRMAAAVEAALAEAR